MDNTGLQRDIVSIVNIGNTLFQEKTQIFNGSKLKLKYECADVEYL